MQNNSRPVIGISGGRGPSASLAAVVSQIRAVGGIPKVLYAEDYDAAQKYGVDGYVAKTMEGLDAVYIMGNDNDVDPASYGEEKHPATNTETDMARRDYELALIRQALERKMPLVGICGGLQRINTLDHAVNGGTLIQHVPDVVGDSHHQQGDIPPFVPVQVVRIEEGTVLADIADSQQMVYTPGYAGQNPKYIEENSFHHQAVGKVHKEFRVCASSEDGIIEAIEPKADGQYGGQFVMGIQWHPEFGTSDIGPKLATRVMEEAKAYARTQQAARTPSHAQRETERRQRVTGRVLEV